ncbi:MAG: VOC family protein [Nostoc sp.]|uniref:VOC family protein n=1 Tax=unclassified Nostoc TaxID=2593658 RepID=UPI000C048FE4|nr:VOC family protein [Nostoc sp. 'Peltigera malacea cyanobiont' DB3992]PHM11336.1 bleomycin resistance protein [Nostoc sp. 'Peltigera malacea cyanobiont' DB3992]
MSLVSGIHHVAVVTADIDRFIDFYTDVFEMPVIFQETTPAFRHALLLAGSQSVLHAAEMPNNIHSSGLPDMFRRGHIDHLALNAPTESAFQIIRRKLIDRGVSDGAIADLGPVLNLSFSDPDGMHIEVCLIVDASLQGFHQPQPYLETINQ